jgi:AP-1 complex subunit sigma 1/2
VQVCELDLVFNFHKAYYILDEVALAGSMIEGSKKAVMRAVSAQDALIDAASENS